MEELKIALVGSPNSGKTTIFNNLTGSRQHVGNYPGVTVEHKSGLKKYKNHKIFFTDLPGIYSLTAYSEEEIITRDYIINEKPDIVLNIIDASNLERNLYLSTQLIELQIPLIFVFNMFDYFGKSGSHLNDSLLSKLLGGPIVFTVGNKNKGTNALLEAIINFDKKIFSKKININYSDEIENEIIKIKEVLAKENLSLKTLPDLRWLSVKILEEDKIVIESLKNMMIAENFQKLSAISDASITHIKNIMRQSPQILIAEARYGFIKGALKESLNSRKENKELLTDKIDNILINRYLGLPIFALIIWIMFQIVFKLGDYPVNWLSYGFSKLANLLNNIIPSGLLKSLLVDGIIGGVGGILVFTPKIMLLFIFIAFLEDSGYMARAAFIMDRIMHKIGLHGKSFIPMLIGFGCSIPAYMCTRTLENKKDRLITMHINTFMSCGGRLPIYILFAGIFFPKNSGNIIFSIYITGIVIAILMAKFLRVTRFKGETEPFVMELPPYRMPTLKSVSIHMWERTWLYLKKAGTIILAISVLMWFLFAFPLSDINKKADIENSYASKIGHFIAPVFKPLGFDWRLSLASLSGIAGKEVVVSTMGTLFSLTAEKSGSGQTNKTGTSGEIKSIIAQTYNPLIGYTFMLFSMLYFPCIAALAVFQREAGFKEMLFQVSFTLTIAWILSFAVFQIGRIFI
ncbi:MAG: ferrous iron transport protein B [Actinobacteria bacterium]|nr:ferrous iron transport protein B [Cyanobacteriota bacterium]MCL6087326.1 ferrous iron transport protein B [Actinomycetota bacterium]